MRPIHHRSVLAVLLVMLVATACTSDLFETDRSAPTVVITSPGDGGNRTTTPFDITGTALDDGGIDRVEFTVDGGSATPCDLNAGGFVCSVEDMSDGDHTVTVRVIDAAGNVGQDTIVMTFGANGGGEGPTVVIESPDDGDTPDSTPLTVNGTVSGGSGIDAVSVAASSGFANACTHLSGTFTCELDALYPGSNTLTVYAADAAGNVGQEAVTVEYVPDPALTITSPAEGTGVRGSRVTIVGTFEASTSNVDVAYALDGGTPSACAMGTARFLCEVDGLSGSDHELEVTLGDDGGSTLASDTVSVDSVSEGFDIELDFFEEGFSQDTRDAFDEAVDVWEAILVSDLEDVDHDASAGESCEQNEPGFTGTIDDLLIFVTSFSENSNVLGVAGPCLSRTEASPDAGTNFVGYLQLNAQVLGDYPYDRRVEIIAHEIGHVLGFGTNWEFDPYVDVRDYVTDPPGGDCFALGEPTTYLASPRYVGAGGLAAWTGVVGGSGVLDIEDQGGPATQCGHWEEDVHGLELMTGFLSENAANPLSALSIASFADLGLTVDTSDADPYPSLRAQDHEPGERLNETLLTPRVAD